ncbi:hypothetical protein BGZ63DRAFT_359407 [Mariannaea sp. PMI_226]|nr:hypothetical protein BGZ63DRAFT_359407 [Mariannaea sp. PMI_226]
MPTPIRRDAEDNNQEEGTDDNEDEEDYDSHTESPPPPQTSQRGEANINHDPYLQAFAEGEFSSPSTYPPFTQPTTRHNDTQPNEPQSPTPNHGRRQNRNQTLPRFASLMPEILTPPLPSVLPRITTAPRNPSAACLSDQLNRQWPPAPSRTTSQLSSSTNAGESQSTLHTVDSLDESPIADTPFSSFSSNNMPQTRRQSRGPAPAQPGTHSNKRRRTSVNTSAQAQLNATPTKEPRQRLASKDINSLFESPPPQVTPGTESRPEDLPTIDLTEANEVPEELKKPEEDKRIKLSAFQCVICMDDATTLTVTHCGHLYCAQCLHSSLHVDATKGKCPMCRQKLDMKPRDQYNTKTKGYWPLELKLMTATRKGKRKANTIS